MLHPARGNINSATLHLHLRHALWTLPVCTLHLALQTLPLCALHRLLVSSATLYPELQTLRFCILRIPSPSGPSHPHFGRGYRAGDPAPEADVLRRVDRLRGDHRGGAPANAGRY